MKYLVYVFLVVIANPYEDIDYNKINSYDIDQEYCSDCINVWSADGYNEPDPEPTREETNKYIPGQDPFLDFLLRR